MFRVPVYIRIWSNRMMVRNVAAGREVQVEPERPFSTSSLLLGQFHSAVETMKRGLREAKAGAGFFSAPEVLIQPMEMIEGGLSEVEDRVLREVPAASGAKKVVVWLGDQLDDERVRQYLRDPSRAAA